MNSLLNAISPKTNPKVKTIERYARSPVPKKTKSWIDGKMIGFRMRFTQYRIKMYC